MFTSIVAPVVEEQAPESSPAMVWIGFLFVAAFFVIEVLFVVIDLEEARINVFLTLIVIGGWIYWLVCVYRLHKILGELSRNHYPISPGEAAAKHIVPFYNLYWVFKWPAELSDYLNSRGRVGIVSGYLIGAMLLLGLILRFIDGALGMAVLFGVTMYVSAKLNKHVKAVRGVSPELLPPLPDPDIFSRPRDSSPK